MENNSNIQKQDVKKFCVDVDDERISWRLFDLLVHGATIARFECCNGGSEICITLDTGERDLYLDVVFDGSGNVRARHVSRFDVIYSIHDEVDGLLDAVHWVETAIDSLGDKLEGKPSVEVEPTCINGLDGFDDID